MLSILYLCHLAVHNFNHVCITRSAVYKLSESFQDAKEMDKMDGLWCAAKEPEHHQN